MLRLCFLVLSVLFSFNSRAENYPDMVGIWKADLRTISSSGEVAKGGMVVSEISATVTIDFQDREVFMGKVRLSSMGKNDPSTKMWGTIRSNGKEAMFIGSDGTRGPIWFTDEKTYEFCVTNLSDSGAMMGYCGVFKKQEG